MENRLVSLLRTHTTLHIRGAGEVTDVIDLKPTQGKVNKFKSLTMTTGKLGVLIKCVGINAGSVETEVLVPWTNVKSCELVPEPAGEVQTQGTAGTDGKGRLFG